MEEDGQMNFNITKNHPTERRYVLVKPLGNTFQDNLRRLLFRR